MGKFVRVKINQAEYEAGLVDCCSNIHGRLTLRKGDSPLTTLALKMKLSKLWPNILNWDLTPLGKGFFEFHFNTVDDMRRVWAMGAVSLKLSLMRFFCWSCDFIPQAQAQTHAQIWVQLLHLPQEYWRKKTLMEIASGLGTPLIIDDTTLNRRFRLYVRVLVDVDLSEKLFKSIIVEREGHTLSVMVQYKKQPSFCTHCKMLGHDAHNCSKLNSANLNEGNSKSVKKVPSGLQHSKPLHSININGNRPAMIGDDISLLKNDATFSKQGSKPADTNKQHSYATTDHAFKDVAISYATVDHAFKDVAISRQHQNIVHNNNMNGKLLATTQEDSTLNNSKSVPKNKKPVKQPVMSQGANFNHKQNYETATIFGAAKTLVRNTDWDFLDNSDQKGPNNEGGNADVLEIATTQRRGDSSTLSLHNSFDILHEDSELPLGEVMLADKDTNHNSIVELVESTVIIDQVSKEIVHLNQIANSKVSDDVNNEPSEPAILNSTKNILEADAGSQTFTTSVPHSPEQCSQAGRRLHPSAATVSAIFVGDPNLSKQAASSKIATYDDTIITPITTYDENLGPDKGRISQPANSKNTSEACKKREKLLSKFWVDGLDSDHAFDEGTDMSYAQEQNLERDIEEGSLFTPFMSRKQKNNKKKYVNKLNDTGVQNTFSDHIQTRYKKGVIKSNPKYL